MQAALLHELAGRSAEVTDLLRDWDDSGVGAVDQRDFRRALPFLGLQVDHSDSVALFNQLSKKGPTGAAELNLVDLHSKLHAELARAHAPRRRGQTARAASREVGGHFERLELGDQNSGYFSTGPAGATSSINAHAGDDAQKIASTTAVSACSIFSAYSTVTTKYNKIQPTFCYLKHTNCVHTTAPGPPCP